MSQLKNKKILVAVTGSIAAYKSAVLVRELMKKEAEVRVIMTPSACTFISPLTLSSLSRNDVIHNLTDNDNWNHHVEYGLWADCMLIAPATANTISKMALGVCDNFVTACYLSARCPVYFAPAMDLDMWNHPSTQKNINTLLSYGDKLIPVEYGELASGLIGQGRMAEPANIVDFLENDFALEKDFAGKKVLITSGPTIEAIDPVRYITNHSSGKMGKALAEQLLLRGADVLFVSGPSQVYPLPHLKLTRIDVISAMEMHQEVFKHFDRCDIAIMAAAVSDYRPKVISGIKIKKKEFESLDLTLNPDISKEAGNIKRDDQILIGFALETNEAEKNALDKLNKKNMDMIILNSLEDEGAGFGVETNKINILFKDGRSKKYSLKDKKDIAKDIIDNIFSL
jgi:phosphopantothenoylcysteine decarboxylase / phosphopantothenate---cysteine ligase